jgi:hypothetical protein
MNQTNQHHTADMLTMTKRQTSGVVAALLFIFFMSFIMGYFLGTKHATEEFIVQMHQESFADQLFSSVCSLGNTASELMVDNECPQNIPVSIENSVPPVCIPVSNPLPVVEDNGADELYAAELIGFGKRDAAAQFMARVTRNTGVNLELRTRHSKNGKGSVTTWYQVVTQRYPSKAALNNDLEQIAKKETLRDINIVTCKIVL